MFIDRAKIHVQAGKGGNGCQSLYKDLYNRRGIPDGGPGGRGGDIILIADENKQTLLDFKYNRLFKGNRGRHGSSNNKKGEDGKPLYIKVPPGTMVLDAQTQMLFEDLIENGQEFVAALGGEAGKGNSNKRDATEGQPGEEKDLILQLKLIADIGIVGLPNAGKSSIISRLSDAKPQIANFPFTTKSPVLGVIQWKDYTTSVIADIPGLIEGAHLGKGLGHEFLRHIERTKLILHVVDLDPYNGRDPVSDYHTINNELKYHSEYLAELPQVIAANKLDLTRAKERFLDFKKKIRRKVIGISAATGEGLEDMMDALHKKIMGIRKEVKK